ncbi:photosystem I reaction center subunit PsaK [Synechococcus sp. PCC 7335]|uniref:Photosystem I reaction center subunit PsaK n=1 Tax=Synechococcus sp. (strain ATCC 29403 / PCC 7335) TaxID=91464 RepID=A0ACD6B9N6_SYNS7|nr:photosystem I reaction center subunit PsaK [Synechococcus sp. PCC 7335]EDX87778.1 photosystem I reaction center subunit PsaK [Synechococcus sp. PCC 7335]7S3D_K Chain K, Photosystem I reaction center subunit PsaK [Synechococcus sp. PCC 7335]7S3D_T Chain T, Photosystem I reaction center subunit PsaK [Synechococcus sp. PCC 7335]7S3D_k Chain k, Photosystem I reaction center subunit PsaK [Synechococcus sp. PCC 7335]
MLSLVAAAGVVPNTVTWGPNVAIVMIICNLIAFAIGKQVIQIPDAGPAPGTFLGLGLPALLGVTSLGHAIGVGAILGLANIGVL